MSLAGPAAELETLYRVTNTMKAWGHISLIRHITPGAREHCGKIIPHRVASDLTSQYTPKTTLPLRNISSWKWETGGTRRAFPQPVIVPEWNICPAVKVREDCGKSQEEGTIRSGRRLRERAKNRKEATERKRGAFIDWSLFNGTEGNSCLVFKTQEVAVACTIFYLIYRQLRQIRGCHCDFSLLAALAVQFPTPIPECLCKGFPGLSQWLAQIQTLSIELLRAEIPAG